jgi:16S rRNA (guanine1207-N2)-methyltransferase
LNEDDLTADPGVLLPGAVFEVGGFAAAARNGGIALVHWRSVALQAMRAAQVGSFTLVEEPPQVATVTQAIVRVGKGRLASEADIAVAWAALVLGGRLLVHGHNEVGIVSLGKRLAKALDQVPHVLVNRAHGRVICFTRTATQLPMPGLSSVPFDAAHSETLVAEPGVFSGDGLDQGTQLLLTYITHMTVQKAPHTVVDMGCGAGHLGLAALRLWPQAQVILVDGDRRAVRSATLNVERLGHAKQASCQWWDVSETLAVPAIDLVLINPPCHAGVVNDYSIARRMFHQAATILRSGGQALIVANRQLPYEAELSALGSVSVVQQLGSFKLLVLHKS